MRRILAAMLCLSLILLVNPLTEIGATMEIPFRLGNEVLLDHYRHLIEGKRVGLITNPTGVDSQGRLLMNILAEDPAVDLVALFGPEHGLDGKASAGHSVKSYIHPELGIQVHSLYGDTRKPTAAMLQGIDVLLFDIQDIGARSYTFISTMNYAMQAAQENGISFVVLDRPNPIGGEIAEGPMMEERFITFVGVDHLPMTHGMTIGELARYFNRKIGVNLTVVPMEGYTRDMIWQDTGLTWIPTSPMIPDIDAAFGYGATGLGEGTGIGQQDTFKWIGGKGIDSQRFADLLNGAGLPGVTYLPEVRGSYGGVRLQITDYRRFNPAKSGLYALAFAQQLTGFKVPKSGSTQASIVMFDKIMGTDKVGQWLEQKLSPQEMEARYAPGLNAFRQERQRYLIYGYLNKSGVVSVLVDNTPIYFDAAPFIDGSDRVMVPLRAIGEALGANVHWDAATRQVTMTKGTFSSRLTIGKQTATVNGQEKLMDTSAVITQNRTMVPVRFVSEFLGANVQWNASERAVVIRTR
ncbi:MAG: exo-beta-N-acetylmuramidase NamZ domain-containing protein [Bacillota bacterium]|jgi:uncharacterized protein YbbC (DUF1343 family)